MTGPRKPEGVSMRFCKTATLTIPADVHADIARIRSKTREWHYEIIRRLVLAELARLQDSAEGD